MHRPPNRHLFAQRVREHSTHPLRTRSCADANAVARGGLAAHEQTARSVASAVPSVFASHVIQDVRPLRALLASPFALRAALDSGRTLSLHSAWTRATVSPLFHRRVRRQQHSHQSRLQASADRLTRLPRSSPPSIIYKDCFFERTSSSHRTALLRRRVLLHLCSLQRLRQRHPPPRLQHPLPLSCQR